MSVARHHAEWLSLLDISGPFLSMPVLLSAFPQGLDSHDADHARELRAAYEEWADNQAGLRPDPAIHTAWIRYVLEQTLELPPEVIVAGQAIPEGLKATVPEHGEILRPDLVIVDPHAPQKPRLLIQVYPAGQDLEKSVAERLWQATSGTRLMLLLRTSEVRLGLVTNGEQWLLVDAPRDGTTGFISWYAGLWLEEALTLRAFRTLLRAERFFNVPDDQTLEALLAASAKDQQEVTDQLGYQVRRAVEILVQAIDRADQDRGRSLLVGVDEATLYEAALTVMMRLVFLLSTEERKLLPLDDPFYSANYAIATLRGQLSEQADKYGEELLEYRYDAWNRLLATFRVVHGGLYHDRLTIPAYGGSLFDPDRYPFLEGRGGARTREGKDARTRGGEEAKTREEKISASSPHESSSHESSPHLASPLPINNRTVLHLLNALQLLQVKVPGGGPAEARRLSFRALDIEQIGHVYEGLLDHTAVRATQPVLGLIGTRDREPEIPLAKLEAFLEQGRDEKALLEFLQEQTGRSESALKKAINNSQFTIQSQGPPVGNSQLLRAACGNDDTLYRRVLPWASLIRDDDFGQPVVIPAGSVYVTAGAERRATGTHYTPKALTEPIVQHTLEPLVYHGPAEGLPPEQWKLRAPANLLVLKICDMAMGSGAFLVQTCRYLSERLVEAWAEAEAKAKKSGAAGKQEDKGENNSPLPPGSPAPLLTPEGQPTTNPDEAIPADATDRLIIARRLVADRCLYGVDKNPLAVEMAKLSLWLITLDKKRPFTFLDHALKSGDSLVGVNLDQLLCWSLTDTTRRVFETESIRTDIEQMAKLRRQLEGMPVNTIDDQASKAYLLAKAEAIAADLRRGGDMLIGSYFNDLSGEEQEHLRYTLLQAFREGKDVPPDRAKQADLGSLRPFHWPLEFPEVFLAEGRKGFDAFVGNPPFVGGMRIKRTLGETYQNILPKIYPQVSKNADLVVFFLIQSYSKLSHCGYLGLITTKTVAEGDSRESGLSRIIKQGGKIIQAITAQSWPGGASVLVTVLHITKTKWIGKIILNHANVHNISSFLTDEPELVEPFKLVARSEQIFTGTAVYGDGFLLDDEQVAGLIEHNPNNKEIIQKYITGKTFCSTPQIGYTGWIINFSDKTEKEAKTYSECYNIIEENVKPYRLGIRREAYRKYWWQFGEKRPGLYTAISKFEFVLATARVSKYFMFEFLPADFVFLNTLFILPFQDYAHFSVLQSNIHSIWALQRSSSVGITTQYTPDDCFNTFPFPANLEKMQNIVPISEVGQNYHQHRKSIIVTKNLSLTDTYNLLNDPDETAADITRLRQLHVEMDQAVAAAYGWADLSLGHDFHRTAQGLRFTISESARREVLGRLLELNHQRYEEEVLTGLHEKKKGGEAKKQGSGGRRSTSGGPDGQLSLF